MGTLIVIIAFVIEAAFAAYCIITKSNQKKVRSIVWIGALVAFAAFTLVSVIEWGTRWYGLVVLLLVWAALGAWALSRKRIDAAFAPYRMGRQAHGENLGRLVRIGALVALAIVTLLSAIAWRTRWRELAILLLVWAALAAWTLSRKQLETNDYKTWHSVVNALVMLLLVVVAVSPALIFPQHATLEMTGKYPIATATYTYTDASRIETFTASGEQREVNVKCWYPGQTAGKYPLVVFSPGSFGTRTSNTSGYRELASNGYVVCSIDHPYHSFYTTDANGKLTLMSWSFFEEALGVNNDKYDDQTKFALTKQWMEVRTADINLVLDTIIARAADPASGPVYQLIDTKKIGLMGHSLGGAAVVQVARDRHDIDAVINLDADLIGEYLDSGNGKPAVNRAIYPVPVLSIYSDDMVNLLVGIADPNNVVAGKYIAATAPHAYEVHIAGTNHLSLTDLPLSSPFLMNLLNRSVHVGGGEQADKYAVITKMNGFAMEFFDEYLKGVGSFTTTGTP